MECQSFCRILQTSFLCCDATFLYECHLNWLTVKFYARYCNGKNINITHRALMGVDKYRNSVVAVADFSISEEDLKSRCFQFLQCESIRR